MGKHRRITPWSNVDRWSIRWKILIGVITFDDYKNVYQFACYLMINIVASTSKCLAMAVHEPTLCVYVHAYSHYAPIHSSACLLTLPHRTQQCMLIATTPLYTAMHAYWHYPPAHSSAGLFTQPPCTQQCMLIHSTPMHTTVHDYSHCKQCILIAPIYKYYMHICQWCLPVYMSVVYMYTYYIYIYSVVVVTPPALLV